MKNIRKYNEFLVNEGVFGWLAGKAMQSLRKVGTARERAKITEIASDYRDQLSKHWDDFFDASKKYAAAKREYDAAPRSGREREIARAKLNRADMYLSAVEKHRAGVDELMRRRAKTILAANPDLKDAFENMISEINNEMNVQAKARWKTLTDKDLGYSDTRDKKRDYLFDFDDEPDDEPESGDKPSAEDKPKPKTLKELGISDTFEFALSSEDEFWSKVNMMSKENLKILVRAMKRQYSMIGDSLADEVRELEKELKILSSKADGASIERARTLRQDIASAKKFASQDQSVLLERIDDLQSKIDTEFHGIR